MGAGLPAAAHPASASASAAPRRLKLVVAGGHPDDPESTSGGTIARYADQGHEVVALYLTRGEGGIPGKSEAEAASIRTAEAEAACRILGARPRFVGQIDGRTEVTAARYDEMRAILEEEAPDLVLTHWPLDTHRDHRACSLLVHDAWLRLRRRFTLYYHEAMTGVQTHAFHPTHYVDITSTAARKKAACEAHRSQDPPSFWPLHAEMQRFRAHESRTQEAEAFSAADLVPLP
jgi:LmbE family N-acetylglucosaminyl deacetylase